VGLSVPYSDEYRDLVWNEDLARAVARAGGGKVVGNLGSYDPFAADLPPSYSSTDAWPYLLWLAAALFVADVAARRLSLRFGRLAEAAGTAAAGVREALARRRAAPERTEAMEGLMEATRRAGVSGKGEPAGRRTAAQGAEPGAGRAEEEKEEEPETSAMTRRLMEAKKRAREKMREDEEL
jgi:hypothetical protein